MATRPTDDPAPPPADLSEPDLSETRAGWDSELDRAVEVISAAGSLALVCHHTPDGDALGSMMAVHHLATAAGKQVVSSWPEPFKVAPHYSFIPGLELATKPADYPARPDVMVSFDCGSIGRLGNLAAAARSAGTLIVVDHHATNEGYGHINVIDEHAAASAVVVRRMIERLGWPLNREAAACLYTGLVCDTGRFQHDNTTPEVFAFAAELAAFDLPIAAMSRQLFEQHRFAYLQLVGDCIARTELDRDLHFVASWVTAADLEAHGCTLEETEGLIDIIRRAAEAEVACVLKEAPEGVRVSLRAATSHDVAKVAARFGGGGHRYAAGFTASGSIAEVLAAIKGALADDPPPAPAS